ncbi:MAG: prepilin peptidase [Candidatus Omnitrophica bacterium]|nr:prepilin peptidase [Candidatus Omnitrophota bacterium]
MIDTAMNVFVFIFGSLVGSFLNVCIHRLPLGESIVWPGSHCPECKKPIPWYLNIPLVSFIYLLGRCRYCRKPIPMRYFIVELLTACAFLMIARHYGIGYRAFMYAALACGLIIATFVDLKHRIIPDEISLGGIAVGFIFNAGRGFTGAPGAYDLKPAVDSFLGIIVGGGIIFLMGFVFDLVYFKLLKKPPIQGETESMGGGDVKLLAMIGAFLGWKAAVLTFFIAPFLGIVAGLVNMIVKKDHLIPYGPFLSLAACISVFWADTILDFVFLAHYYR